MGEMPTNLEKSYPEGSSPFFCTRKALIFRAFSFVSYFVSYNFRLVKYDKGLEDIPWGFYYAKDVMIMPRKPKHPCGYPGCPELTDKRYCLKHQKLENRQYEKYDRDPTPQ